MENGRKFNIKSIKSDGDCKHERKWIKPKKWKYHMEQIICTKIRISSGN